MWDWRRRNPRAHPRPQDRVDADARDETGIVGVFPTASLRPLALGVGITATALGVVLGSWMSIAGVGIIASQVALLDPGRRPVMLAHTGVDHVGDRRRRRGRRSRVVRAGVAAAAAPVGGPAVRRGSPASRSSSWRRCRSWRTLAERTFAGHMVQHLIVIILAAPLLVLARPVHTLLLAGWLPTTAGGPPARRVVAPLRRRCSGPGCSSSCCSRPT